MKKFYENPELQLIAFEKTDVIATSVNHGEGDDIIPDDDP